MPLLKPNLTASGMVNGLSPYNNQTAVSSNNAQAQPAQDSSSSGQRSIESLSNEEYITLRDSIKSGKLTADSQKIIGSLDNKSYQQVKSALKAPAAPVQSTSIGTSPTVTPPGINSPQQAPVVPAQTQSTLDKVANSPVVSGINAAGGGIHQAMIDIPNAVQSGLSYAANKLGIISNKHLAQLDSNRHSLNDQMGQTNDVTQQAMQQHPWIANTARYGLDAAASLAPAALGAPAAASALEKAVGGVAAPMAANMIQGAGMMPDQYRGIGAAVGGAGSVVADLAGKFLNGMTKLPVLKDNINKIVTAANSSLGDMTTTEAATKAISNKVSTVDTIKNTLYDSFRKNDQNVDTSGLVAKISALSEKKLLQPDQVSVLTDTAERLKDAKSIADIHDILKENINDMQDTFIDRNTSKVARNTYDQVKSLFNTKLTEETKAAGVLDQYQKADQFYKSEVIPLQRSGAYKVWNAVKPDSTMPQADKARVIDNIIDKSMGGKSGSPERLKALIQSMDDSGQSIVQTHIVNKMVDNARVGSGGFDPGKMIVRMNQLKQSFGTALDEDHQSMIDGISKLIGEAGRGIRLSSPGEIAMGGHGIIKDTFNAILNHTINTELGQKILVKIGQSPNGRAIAGQLLKSTSEAVSSATTTTHPDTSPQGMGRNMIEGQ